jgi:hypothetical protein
MKGIHFVKGLPKKGEAKLMPADLNRMLREDFWSLVSPSDDLEICECLGLVRLNVRGRDTYAKLTEAGARWLYMAQVLPENRRYRQANEVLVELEAQIKVALERLKDE